MSPEPCSSPPRSHGEAHTHTHGEAGHASRDTAGSGLHAHDAASALDTLRLGAGLTAVLFAVETLAAWHTRSLALLADAGHVLTDLLALALSWYALYLAQRPPDRVRTFGFHRSQILVALFNSLTLLLLAGYIFKEALERFWVATPVESQGMLLAGAVAVGVNLYLASRLHAGHAHNLNVRSAWLHVVGDVLASLGVVLTAAVLRVWPSFLWLDPLVGVGISLLIALGAVRIVREASRVLMETVPKHLDPHVISARLCVLPGVEAVHDLHVWSLTEGLELLSCHLVLRATDIGGTAALLRQAQEVLSHDFGILHATLQPEWEPCALPHAVCTLAGSQRLEPQPAPSTLSALGGVQLSEGRERV